MYRIAEDLDLEDLVGSSIKEICLDRFNLRIYFECGITFNIEGNVSIVAGGSIVSTWNQADNWSTVEFQRLFSFPVSHYSVPHDRLLEIEFSNQTILRLHDESDQYESFLITRKDRDEIIVV